MKRPATNMASLIVALAFVSSGAMVSSAEFYYDLNDTFQIVPSENALTVQFRASQGLQDGSRFLNAHPCLDPNVAPEELGRGFRTYHLQPYCDRVTAASDLMTDPAVVRTLPVYLAPSDSFELKVTDQISIQFNADLLPDSILKLLAANGLVFLDSSLLTHNLWHCILADTATAGPITIGNQMHVSPSCQWACATFIAPIATTSPPNDPYYFHQWYFKNFGQSGGAPGKDINMEPAWAVTLQNSAMKVAILDEGIETHEDLPPSRIEPGYDCIGPLWWYIYRPDSDATPGTYRAHGMACAGILAASHDDTGIAGIFGSCHIVPVKIADDNGDNGNTSSIAEAISWAAASGAKVVSNSWGFLDSLYRPLMVPIPDVANAIRGAVRPNAQRPHRCIVVFASGNSARGEGVYDSIGFPASMPEVITVGAVNAAGGIWDYSCFGSPLDVVAPSGEINYDGDLWTIDQMGTDGWNPYVSGPHGDTTDYDYTAKMGGTSGACPQVAGVAALILARRPEFGSDTTGIVQSIIENTATLGKPTSGHGRVNAYRALLSVIRGDVDNSGRIDTVDVHAMRDYCFKVGSPPTLDRRVSDTDCDGNADICDYLRTLGAALAGTGIPPCFSY